MLAMMGDNVEHVISYWVMFQSFHSAVLGGYAVISHWLPFLFFSVYSGALADRYDCRRLCQRAGTAILGGALCAVAVIGFAMTNSYTMALVLLMLIGALRIVFSSMAQALVQLLAPAEIRGRVMGLFFMAQAGLHVGSGITVGLIGALIGVHLSLGLSAVAFLLATIALYAFTWKPATTTPTTLAEASPEQRV